MNALQNHMGKVPPAARYQSYSLSLVMGIFFKETVGPRRVVDSSLSFSTTFSATCITYNLMKMTANLFMTNDIKQGIGELWFNNTQSTLTLTSKYDIRLIFREYNAKFGDETE